MRLSEIGEFGLINKLRKQYSQPSAEILAGIGDDAAALKISAGKILVTADMLAEGIHFDRSFTTFHQLGYKFLAVNISDIFAMGGVPKFFFISLGIPANYKAADIEELYSGISEIAEKHDIIITGGDTCASQSGLILSGTLIGKAGRIITRAGASSGDRIFVADTLGDSAMGLMLLNSQGAVVRGQGLKDRKVKFNFKTHNSKIIRLNSKAVLPLLKKHLMPEPRPLKNTSRLTSMIDVSDGLLIDLDHICEESGAGALIYEDKIPMSEELVVTAKAFGMDPLQLALKGGEDYTLLFTAPPDTKTNAVMIGEIISKGRFIIDGRGRKRKFKPEGYEHFKNERSNIKRQKYGRKNL